MKKLKQSTLKNKLDALWRIDVRAAAGNCCEKCGMPGKFYQLVCHHIKGKGANPALRWYVPNGCLLCIDDHGPAHRSPKTFKSWIIEKRGAKWYSDLIRMARSRNKVDKLQLLENWGLVFANGTAPIQSYDGEKNRKKEASCQEKKVTK